VRRYFDEYLLRTGGYKIKDVPVIYNTWHDAFASMMLRTPEDNSLPPQSSRLRSLCSRMRGGTDIIRDGLVQSHRGLERTRKLPSSVE